MALSRRLLQLLSRRSLKSQVLAPKIAESVHEFFSIPENVAVIERLRQAGVMLEEEKPENELPQTLAGLTFVLREPLSTSHAMRLAPSLKPWEQRFPALYLKRQAL